MSSHGGKDARPGVNVDPGVNVSSDVDVSSGEQLDRLAEQWRSDLASWGIPEEILAQAPEPPWIHPVEMFAVEDEIPDSVSRAKAIQALPIGGSVLDVGCGGGRASLALVPGAGQVIGVDHQPAMLEAFAGAADRRGVAHAEFLGEWLEVEVDVPSCDLVVCHHVAYNVADIVGFLRALDQHGRGRVVLELPLVHPLTHLNPLWKRFWDLDRPTRPTAYDLRAIAEAMGLQPGMQAWVDESWGNRVALPMTERVRFARIRLCLPAERDPQVAAALEEQARTDPGPRRMATLWWDASVPERGQG